ncbi:MAG: hypothetical protein IJK02_03595 [Clostridia bacterium]|nr:hypothetical protein [Clostridia bacterium]
MTYYERVLLMLGVSLALTLLIETGLALLFKKRGRQLLFVLLANVFTNPAVVLITHYGGGTAFFVGAEIFAVLAEWLIYKFSGENFRRPFLFSLTLNVISCGLGILINAIT